MADAIRRMRQYIADRDVEGFSSDPMAVDAVVRTLEIISGASRRLSPELKAQHPEVASRLVAGAGNVYRHNYDDLDVAIVYDTATVEVMPLVEALRREGVL